MGATQAKCYGSPVCGWRTEAPFDEIALEVLPALGSSAGGLKRRGRIRSSEWLLEHELRVGDLLLELFWLHDLNGDGLLQEAELIRLNEQIAIMHRGDDVDLGSVREKYRDLFRSALDPNGEPVSSDVFCDYTRKVLDGLDADPVAQEMILEQWSVEARTCRELFPGWSANLGRAQLQPSWGPAAAAAASAPGSAGLEALAPKELSVDGERDAPSTADESLTDTGADSDSDVILLGCASGASSLGRGPRSSRSGETDEECSLQVLEELPGGCQVHDTELEAGSSTSIAFA